MIVSCLTLGGRIRGNQHVIIRVSVGLLDSMVTIRGFYTKFFWYHAQMLIEMYCYTSLLYVVNRDTALRAILE